MTQSFPNRFRVGLTRRTFALAASAGALSACAPRGTLGLFPDDDAPTAQSVWAIAIGDPQPVAVQGIGTLEKRTLSRFARYDVSIPENHTVGEITWPRGQIDPARDFYISGLDEVAKLDDVMDRVAVAAGPDQDVTVFVHGYNTNYAEAVYRHAQIANDLESTAPQISVIWPSEGAATGYLTDRDTALIVRDQLEPLLIRLTDRFPGRVILAAHSMGAFLIMETLRQMSIGGTDVNAKLGALVLVSPDIRIDVFQAQVARMPRLPDTTVIIVSQTDRALMVSSRLAGGKPRLGSAADIDLLAGMDLLVIDLSDLPASGSGNHLALATSPAALAFVRALSRQGDLLRERRDTGLLVLRVPLPIPR